MGFYERIISFPNKFDTEALFSAMRENARDQLTLTQVETQFNLNATESNDMQNVINVFAGDPPTMGADEVREVLVLASAGAAYTTVATLKTRLGTT